MKIRCLHSLNFLMDSLVKGRTCSMVRQIKILICLYLLPLKTDHPGVVLVTGHSVNDIPLFSKGADRAAVWAKGSRNKYDRV